MSPVASAGETVAVAVKSWEVDPDGDMRWEVRSYDASSGALSWTHRYRTLHQELAGQTRTSGFVTFPAIEGSRDGRQLYVLGVGYLAIDVFALDAGDGDRLWTSLYQAGESSWAAGLTLDRDGDRVYVGGCSDRNEGTMCDLEVLAYEAR
jgi:outer membrane protein assembly factor BamB